jgi:hypothetical protein
MTKIHEAIQDGQHNANEVMREVYKAMKRMGNDTAKHAFKEELLRQIEREFEWFDVSGEGQKICERFTDFVDGKHVDKGGQSFCA